MPVSVRAVKCPDASWPGLVPSWLHDRKHSNLVLKLQKEHTRVIQDTFITLKRSRREHGERELHCRAHA